MRSRPEKKVPIQVARFTFGGKFKSPASSRLSPFNPNQPADLRSGLQ